MEGYRGDSVRPRPRWSARETRRSSRRLKDADPTGGKMPPLQSARETRRSSYPETVRGRVKGSSRYFLASAWAPL